ncbi:hypothetical protein [Streptomyces sp. NPDC051993]|uniref:hypothetical protein n=1 Tax=Streptomyces sp. NPDC051993 TaxID=3155286 RepID=UPI003420152A
MATPADPDRTPVQTAGDQIQAAAEAARARQAVAAPVAPAAPVPLEVRLLANAAAATPEAQRELPLWTGNDLPVGDRWTLRDGVLHDAYGAPQWKLKDTLQVPPRPGAVAMSPRSAGPGTPYNTDLWATELVEPVDLTEAFTRVEEAWADLVPPDLGSAQDLVAAVEDDLRILQQSWRRTVPGPPPTPDSDRQPAASPEPPVARSAADAVNAALQQADQQADAFKDLPEWQHLQTIRGAATHLWDVIKEKAGPYFERLADDIRVQGFWRTVSIRTCQSIAHGCQRVADRLRRGAKGPDLPAAEALLNASDAALAYSNPRLERPNAGTVAAAQQQNLDEIRQLRGTLTSNAPLPYAARDEAVQASREIAAAFKTWADSDMGQELGASSHPRVVEFREAWCGLPSSDLPAGPGLAAGPYAAVAEHAQGIVERAQAQPGRFTPADLAALKTVADLSAHHGGRLAVTLPPGPSSPITPAPAARQAPPRPAVAAPAPAARTGTPRLAT